MNGTDGVDTLLMISEESRSFLLNHTYVILQLVKVKKHSPYVFNTRLVNINWHYLPFKIKLSFSAWSPEAKTISFDYILLSKPSVRAVLGKFHYPFDQFYRAQS